MLFSAQKSPSECLKASSPQHLLALWIIPLFSTTFIRHLLYILLYSLLNTLLSSLLCNLLYSSNLWSFLGQTAKLTVWTSGSCLCVTSITRESLRYHSKEVLNVDWPSCGNAHAQSGKMTVWLAGSLTCSSDTERATLCRNNCLKIKVCF